MSARRTNNPAHPESLSNFQEKFLKAAQHGKPLRLTATETAVMAEFLMALSQMAEDDRHFRYVLSQAHLSMLEALDGSKIGLDTDLD